MKGRLAVAAVSLLSCLPTRAPRRDGGRERARVEVARPAGPPAPEAPRATIPIPAASTTSCQSDADCRHGVCFTPALDAQYSRVFRDCVNGQAWRASHQLFTCIFAGCTSDSECPAGMRCGEPSMVPFPQRACVPASCRSAMDCRLHVRGQCLAYVAAAHCEPGGWACAYENDECAPRDVSRRCPMRPGVISRCVPSRGRFRCVQEGAPLP